MSPTYSWRRAIASFCVDPWPSTPGSLDLGLPLPVNADTHTHIHAPQNIPGPQGSMPTCP